jgi:hypothetical protein
MEREVVEDNNLYDGVDPKCEESYFRCIICFWTISTGWLSLAAIGFSIASLVIQGIGGFSGLSDDAKTKLALASIIITACATGTQILQQHALKSIAERMNTLKQLIYGPSAATLAGNAPTLGTTAPAQPTIGVSNVPSSNVLATVV